MTAIHHPTLASDALALPEEERATLALLLVDSLAEPVATSWPDALVVELKRRSDDLKSGRVRRLSSDEVFGTSL